MKLGWELPLLPRCTLDKPQPWPQGQANQAPASCSPASQCLAAENFCLKKAKDTGSLSL